MDTLTEEVKAYIAGIIDGEGCIAVNRGPGRRTPTFVAYVDVTMTDFEAIELIVHFFKGGLSTGKHPSGRQFKRFYAYGTNAGELLEAVKPYIRVKKNQLELVLQFLSLPGGTHGVQVPDWLVGVREYFASESHKLNQREGK